MIIKKTHFFAVGVMKDLIEKKISELLKLPLPPGLALDDVRKSWFGNKMVFSFHITAARLVKIKVKGTIEVSDENVTLESALPKSLLKFVGEDSIISIISDNYDKVMQTD